MNVMSICIHTVNGRNTLGIYEQTLSKDVAMVVGLFGRFMSFVDGRSQVADIEDIIF